MNYVPLLVALGAIFLGALVGGRLAFFARIPRVTGYLLAGLVLGPSFARLTGFPELIAPEALPDLRLFADIALALILVNIGGQFQAANLRRWRHRMLLFSLGESGVSFLLVGIATAAVNQFLLQKTVAGLSLWQTSLTFGLFLGIIGIATAPAATLMVIREYESEGPVTQTVLTLVGLNNLVSVLGFAVLLHFLVIPEESLSDLSFRMVGPLAIGGAIGFGLSVWAQRLELSSERKILLLGGVIATTGLCRSLHLDVMIANLALGIVLANSSPRWKLLLEALREFDYPLYVAFFVIAGANLHLETLSHIGVLGVAYVTARTVGKLLGSWIGARMGDFGDQMRRYVGLTLMAQAGVAIGLVGTLASQWPEGGHLLETVVLGAVVVFELVGPLAVRRGLVRSGEVPLLSLLKKRAPQGAVEGLHSVVHHFASGLGLPAGHKVKDPGDILVKHVMRRNVETVAIDTPFNELLRLISHSRYDRFPVVDREGKFAGMINYTEIRNMVFEPSLAQLVVASDLVSPKHYALFPDQTLREAMKSLQLHRDISYFPVIDPDQPDRLFGMLSQNDVLAAYRRLEKE